MWVIARQDMDTGNLTSPTLSPPLEAGGRRPAGAEPAGQFASDDNAQGVFDGLAWTHRPGCERLLADMPAATWMDPEAQGWQRVKHNPRREVWRAVLHGSAYYLKYYFGRRWAGAVQRMFRPAACQAEWEGGAFAAWAGIPAGRPAAYALSLWRGRRRCALLVSEAVEPAVPLDEFWLQLQSDEDPGRRRHDVAQLTERLAEMIARAHQAGFEHLDMHVANVLVQPVATRRYRTVFVDLHSARRGVPISDRAVVRNLAQLNQWFRKHSPVGDRLRFLQAYMRWRDEFEQAYEHGRPLGLTFARLVAALETAARRHAQRLGAQRDRRTVRNGRYFARLRLGGGWRGMAMTRCKHPAEESRASRLVLDRRWWQSQLRDPLRWFEQQGAPACKDSHSAQVRRALFEHGTDPVTAIIKRPLARNWRRRVAQWLPPSRSLRGWRIGHALLHRDVPTARPLVVLERRVGPLVLDSLLVTEAIPGALDLETFLREEYAVQSPVNWARLKRKLGALLAQHLRRLQERGFEHRDCKASNVLVVRYPRLKLLWIDLDGLRRGGPLADRRQLRPLVRLHVSLLDVPGLTRTDRVRFLKSYCARFGAGPGAWRGLWPALQEAAARKTGAKAARRAWKLKHYGRE